MLPQRHCGDEEGERAGLSSCLQYVYMYNTCIYSCIDYMTVERNRSRVLNGRSK